jgi:V8-like Glu-specific endopeptidase
MRKIFRGLSLLFIFIVCMNITSATVTATVIVHEPHTIFGEDDRKQATYVDSFPYSANVFVLATFPNGKSYIGSGAFVGATTVLTAAHVIYSDEDGGFAVSVAVTPGGTESKFAAIPATELVISTGWSENRDFDFDYGVIRVAENPGAGRFTLRAYDDTELINMPVIRYGFDGDKPRGTLWVDRTSTVIGATGRALHHQADSYRGSSGGAIVLHSNPTTIAGIHVASTTINGVPIHNRAVRVNNDVIRFVDANRSACDTAGHRMGEWEYVTAVSCTINGTESRRCLDCGLFEMRTLPAWGHNTGEWVYYLEPSCYQDGIRRRFCIRCPFVQSATVERGHNWGDWEDAADPTFEHSGFRRRICSVCSAVETIQMARLVPKFDRGDVNGNGEIDIGDALAILRFIIGLPSELDDNPFAVQAALITQESLDDGKPSMADALAILRYVIGLPSELDENP